MKLRRAFVVLVGAILCLLLGADLGQAQALKLQRVVLLMRHGVRPPTHFPPLDPAIAPSAWPEWAVPPGNLTPHGAASIRLLAAFDRQYLASLVTAKCPDIGIYADIDERTLATGAAYAEGFAPGCAIPVHHAAGKDPLFSALDGNAANFDREAAKSAMLAASGGSLEAFAKAHMDLLRAMQDVLQPGGSAFLNLPAKIAANAQGPLPKLTGPLATGASAAEDFLLEYLDGKPMGEVAWGRANAALLTRLLTLHPLAYQITARPEPIARATASALGRRILTDLTDGPTISALVGHDTNQAELGGLLDLHWAPAGYPADDIPPGGGILFSLWSDASGARYVTAVYQVQSMDQIRDLRPGQPEFFPIAIPGCGNSTRATACSLAEFSRLLGSKTSF